MKAHVLSFLQQHVKVFRLGPLDSYTHTEPFLREHLECMHVTELGSSGQESAVSNWRAEPLAHVYALYQNQKGGIDVAVPGTGDGGGGGRNGGDGGKGGGGEWAPAAFTSFLCPCQELCGVWESIHVEHGTKQSLLSLSESALCFSLAGVDGNLIQGNKVILLYGEPGTGKTSLARGEYRQEQG